MSTIQQLAAEIFKPMRCSDVVESAQPEQSAPAPVNAIQQSETMPAPAAIVSDFTTPLNGALIMAGRGIPVTPLIPGQKKAFKGDWQQSATTNVDRIQAWAAETPSANWGCVAKAQPGGTWFFEVDRKDVIQRIEAETGHKFPKTFRVRSRDGRGHIYFRHNAQSIALSNKAYISVKDDQGELFSARLNNSYVVAPASVHPDTGKPYQVLPPDREIVEAPNWLIEWIKKNQTDNEKLPLTASVDGPKIPRGSHDNELTRIAGKLRQDLQLDEDEIAEWLIKICEKRCEDYGSDYQEMCQKIAHSIGKKPIVDTRVFHNGVLVGTQTAPAASSAPVHEINVTPYPEFPSWVYLTPSPITGRRPSIYDGLVKPWCELNSRYEAFMFLPAYVLLLNYLGTKVHIRGKSYPLSLFMVATGKKGQVIKSSCAESAMTYFKVMGFLEEGSQNLKISDSKVIIWGAGSAEGLGLAMSRTNCKNAVLYYDELSALDKKSQIECSSLGSTLTRGYEASRLENLVKRQKETYSIESGTYCMSLIACTTDKNFNEQWSRLCTGNDGLDDRSIFLIPPEQLKELTPMIDVNTIDGALETKRLIDKAVLQGTFEIESDLVGDEANDLLRQGIAEGFTNRDEIRAEKLALAFAVDMGLDRIDTDCVRRALDVCRYTIAAKRWLKTMDARDDIAMAQQKVRRLLARRKAGRMLKSELFRVAESEQWSTRAWYGIYNGLIQAGLIREEVEDGRTYAQLLVELQEAL